MEIVESKVIVRNNIQFYFYEVKDKEEASSIFFMFDVDNHKECWIFSDLLGEWLKISQDRKFYKKYIDFIKIKSLELLNK